MFPKQRRALETERTEGCIQKHAHMMCSENHEYPGRGDGPSEEGVGVGEGTSDGRPERGTRDETLTDFAIPALVKVLARKTAILEKSP